MQLAASMFGGAYGDARMPNWPHWHRTPFPGIATTGLRRDKEGQLAACIESYLANIDEYVYRIQK